MDTFSRLIHHVRRAVATLDDPTAVTRAVAQGLDHALASGEMRLPDEAEPGLYHGRLLYEDDDLGFIVVAMAWGAGSSTPIHDHGTWGVFGVLHGALEFTNFRRLGHGDAVEPFQRFVGEPGDVTWIIAPAMEIHQLRNPTHHLATSLHIYGRNIGF